MAPLRRDEGEVNILDLVMHLGRTTRFGGYGDPEWTVLHHSLLTAVIALRNNMGPEVAMHALLHDTHEAYTGDIPSPIKRLIADTGKVDAIGQVEAELDKRIYAHLNIKPPDAATRRKVKQCDQVALILESELFGPTDCDLMATIPEDQRADMVAMVERVVPNYQQLVRRKG